MDNFVVLNNPKDWNLEIEGVKVVSAKSYLTDVSFSELKNARIFNLCKSYKYQTIGYYLTLLAEARGHRSFPNVVTIQDFGAQAIVRIISDEIDELIQHDLAQLKSDEFILSIYFGKNIAKKYEKLSKKLYNMFQTPLLRAKFVYNKKWILQNLAPISLKDIPDSHKPYLIEIAKEYFSKKQFRTAKQTKYLYDLAILVNPEETSPPSDKKAIQNFIEAGRSCGLYVETITRDDYSRIPEFDALFIRETTAVNHHTFRFSRRAHREGLVVIDDPQSIVRCTNKVYLAELMANANIPTPKTIIVNKDNIDQVEEMLGLPCVLKQPDSSFSQGVVKVDDKEQLHHELDTMLKNSDLIIAQEFTPTDFDWRIGILNKQPLYACKYYMAKDHWQIYNWNEKSSRFFNGAAETLELYQVPVFIMEIAIKAASLIGDGLYGVDIKQYGKKAVIIEINDNPSIDAEIEDAVLEERLYEIIMQYFVDKLQSRKI